MEESEIKLAIGQSNEALTAALLNLAQRVAVLEGKTGEAIRADTLAVLREFRLDLGWSDAEIEEEQRHIRANPPGSHVLGGRD